jgi:hypothetical protein
MNIGLGKKRCKNGLRFNLKQFIIVESGNEWTIGSNTMKSRPITSNFFFSCGSTVLFLDPGHLTYRRFLELLRHMVVLLGRVISPSQGLYLHRTTQHRKTRTNIHTLSGIRTHDPSNQPGKIHASDRMATVTGNYSQLLNAYFVKTYKTAFNISSRVLSLLVCHVINIVAFKQNVVRLTRGWITLKKEWKRKDINISSTTTNMRVTFLFLTVEFRTHPAADSRHLHGGSQAIKSRLFVQLLKSARNKWAVPRMDGSVILSGKWHA